MSLRCRSCIETTAHHLCVFVQQEVKSPLPSITALQLARPTYAAAAVLLCCCPIPANPVLPVAALLCPELAMAAETAALLVLSTILVPSLNLALKMTLALLNNPSLSEMTMN